MIQLNTELNGKEICLIVKRSKGKIWSNSM